MARTNQRLINYHTSDKTAMPSGSSVDYGEIVVRHNAESPELLIKVGDDSFGVFQASGAVKTAIDKAVSDAQSTLNTDISNLESKVDKFSGATVAEFTSLKMYADDTFATKTALQTAQTNITNAYTKAVGDAKVEIYNSATTFATNAVNTAKAALDGNISSLETSLTEHVTTFNTFKGNVEKTYATKAELKSTSGGIITAYEKAVADAKVEIYNSATTFATNVKTELNSTISTVKSNLETLSGVVESISTDIGSNYVTTDTLNTTVETLESKISSAQKAATDASSAYTDTKFTAAKSYTDTEIKNAKSDIKQTTDTLNSKIDIFSGNVETTLDALEGTLTETINNKVAVAYRYQGTVTNYADLPKNLTSGETGYVYNVENANGHIPAGTNYAWNGTAWDALGGIVDLSPYAKTEDVNESITNLVSKVGEFSSATVTEFTNLKTHVGETYATKEELKSTSGSIISDYTTAIGNAKDKVYSSATTVAAADAKKKADAAYSSAVTAAAASAETLNNSIEAVDGRVTELSGVTKTVKATADSAVQTASIVDGDTCKVSVNKVGTELQFNFENLVVDCGDF